MSDFDFLKANLAWCKSQYQTACKMLDRLGVPHPQGALVYRLGLIDTLPCNKRPEEPTKRVTWHYNGGRVQ